MSGLFEDNTGLSVTTLTEHLVNLHLAQMRILQPKMYHPYALYDGRFCRVAGRTQIFNMFAMLYYLPGVRWELEAVNTSYDERSRCITIGMRRRLWFLGGLGSKATEITVKAELTEAKDGDGLCVKTHLVRAPDSTLRKWILDTELPRLRKFPMLQGTIVSGLIAIEQMKTIWKTFLGRGVFASLEGHSQGRDS